MVDPNNHSLFANRPGEILISPMIISHMLAQITLRRDMWIVFDELFTADGAEIYFRTPRQYQAGGAPLRFRDIQRLVSAQGDIALGVYFRDRSAEGFKGLYLNPSRDTEWSLSGR